MISHISENLSAIRGLCARYGIRTLDLFGSATTDAFDPNRSDLDFIVDLGEYTPGTADRYMDLASSLEKLLGLPVQLVTEPSIRNPYFRQAVNEQRVRLYESGDRQKAA